MFSLINILYLVAAVLFILGLMGLSHPKTAVAGNWKAAVGMLLAVVATLLDRNVIESGTRGFTLIAAGIAVGAIIGAVFALKIKMTAMPQMVALLNGFGGGASVLIAGAALHDAVNPGLQLLIATAASGIIGAVTFWGSLVAFDKLQEFLLPGKPIHFPMQQPLNALLAIVALALAVWIVVDPASDTTYWALVLVASVLGVLLTIPIGGADMPVAVALLNSYSGLAGAAAGFVLNNNALIITGSLVGASGIILSQIMCKAMNRSLANVLLGKLGSGETTGASADETYAGKVKSTSPEEIAMLLETARRVVIVPGYGLAVSQAQHAVRELATLLESKGTTVEFGIHPVAGRMPGHMNVLLAEAEVPYDQVFEMEDINGEFGNTDVALILGANDVVNPLAEQKGSPIYGMPILEAFKAKTVIVNKRSMASGYAGLDNPLFYMDKTMMVFGDAKKVVEEMTKAIE
jgi:NAD(P) transhydrogenase subunit beta